LCIFFVLIFWKRLAWTFAAETLVIIVIEVIMFFYSMKKIHTLLDAFIVLSLFPLSIVMVAVLESDWVGLD